MRQPTCHGYDFAITPDEPPHARQCHAKLENGTRRCLGLISGRSNIFCASHVSTDRMNATDKLYLCSGCGEQQKIELRGDTEFYEHEGRCPACGEYVVCVGTCIKDDEGEG